MHQPYQFSTNFRYRHWMENSTCIRTTNGIYNSTLTQIIQILLLGNRWFFCCDFMFNFNRSGRNIYLRILFFVIVVVLTLTHIVWMRETHIRSQGSGSQLNGAGHRRPQTLMSPGGVDRKFLAPTELTLTINKDDNGYGMKVFCFFYSFARFYFTLIIYSILFG